MARNALDILSSHSHSWPCPLYVQFYLIPSLPPSLPPCFLTLSFYSLWVLTLFHNLMPSSSSSLFPTCITYCFPLQLLACCPLPLLPPSLSSSSPSSLSVSFLYPLMHLLLLYMTLCCSITDGCSLIIFLLLYQSNNCYSHPAPALPSISSLFILPLSICTARCLVTVLPDVLSLFYVFAAHSLYILLFLGTPGYSFPVLPAGPSLY
jgi:hypothetical protein